MRGFCKESGRWAAGDILEKKQKRKESMSDRRAFIRSAAALDRLNKYLNYHCMPLVSSKYWPMTHGTTPDEVRKDLEGMQILRTLARRSGCMINSRLRRSPAARISIFLPERWRGW